MNRVVCPNFENPTLTSAFTKYKFLQAKNSFSTIVSGLSVLKWFQPSNGDFFSWHAYSTYKVRKTAMTKLGRSVEVRAHYPIYYTS